MTFHSLKFEGKRLMTAPRLSARSILGGSVSILALCLAITSPAEAAKKSPPVAALQPIAEKPSETPTPAAAPVAQEAPAPLVGLIRIIKVEGNERIDADTIISYLPVRVGQAVNPLTIDAMVKTLYRTELFSDVQIALNGNDLDIKVAENPIINQVLFEGNHAMTKDKLRDEVKIRPRGVFTKSKVQSDVQRIIELYRRSGRISAVVSPKIVELPQKRVDLIFELNEGPKTGISTLEFIGNRAFSDNELSNVIVTRKSYWWKFFSSNDNYDPDRIDYDREQLKKFYNNRGYYDFRVVSSVAELTPDQHNFALSYTIDEGKKYNFGKIKVKTENEKLNPAYLEAAIPFSTGQLYEGDKIEKAVDAITYAAGASGFAFVEVHPDDQPNPDTRTVDLTFNVREGARVYIDKINIVGNTQTLDRVIRREMKLSEGDAYNKALVERSKTYVQGLGFFKEESVKIDTVPSTSPDRTSLNVSVTEQPTGQLSFGAGFSSIEKLILDLSVEQSNFRGTGQNVRARISTGTYQKNVDLSFTEPYFMNRPLSAGVDLFSSSFAYRGVSYRTNSDGFGLRLGYAINGYSTLRMRYNLRSDKVSDQTIDPTTGLATGLSGSCNSLLYSCGTGTTSSIGYTLGFDKRNDFITPTRGWLAIFRQDIAGLGGNVSYVRTEGEAHWYHGFARDMILTVSGAVGNIISTRGDSVRINDRWFKGGESLRGFQYAGIGPRDTTTNYALGGQTYATASAELGIPNHLPDQYGLKTAVFIDLGTLGGLDNRVKVDASGNKLSNIVDRLSPRASAGLTIRWKSPMGPVQFDISHIINREKYDRLETFRFSQSTQF